MCCGWRRKLTGRTDLPRADTGGQPPFESRTRRSSTCRAASSPPPGWRRVPPAGVDRGLWGRPPAADTLGPRFPTAVRLRLLALLLTALTLVGCVTASVPPRSALEVAPAYQSLDVTGATVAVVLDADAFVIEDGSAVRAHIASGEDVQAAVHTFLTDRFPEALMQEAPFGEVFVIDAEGLAADLLSPEPGATVALGGREPDFVLYVDALHQYRAKYPTYAPGNPFAHTQSVRQDVDYRLWDNRAGRQAAHGRVESEEDILLFPGRESYEQAVEEMAEQLARELGVRRS